ncbi:GNAT family N-acetyltransferase [Verrucomicrobium sp. GAS474]|uniref:GNAT family N-acetyltransferase n=1 Tax=Verrucomicrobium sp. GAS474 TaxID=1882831 RepID=UPI0031B5C3A5
MRRRRGDLRYPHRLMNVTEANPADLPALCRLLGILFAQEAEFQPDAARQQAGLSRILADPGVGTILVLRDEEIVVGSVILLYTVSTYLGTRAAVLEDLVVDPSWRGQGGGSLLLDAAIARAKAEDCGRITLLTDPDNAAAQELYWKKGFAVSSMRAMRLSL